MESAKIGAKIREAREKLNLSQEEFAALIDRTQRSVSLYESGERRIFANDIPKIARALQVPIIYLYEDVLSEYDLDSEIIEEFHYLNADARKTLITIARLLKDLTQKTDNPS